MTTTLQTVSAGEPFCSIAQHLLCSGNADKLVTKNANPLGAKKFRGIHEFASRICASTHVQFPNSKLRVPELILRFDSRAHSDDNYVYVTPVEG
jgi:hypothetical protein